jgi:hypothetical protein
VAVGVLAATAAYIVWTLATERRVTHSSVPLLACCVGAVLVASLRDRTMQWRIVAVCLLALVPYQFTSFWTDYFSDYRVRSSHWLGGNIGGAMEEMLDREQQTHAPRVYFSTLKATSGLLDGRNPYMDAYWKFYLTKHHREDLLARTAPFEADRVAAAPPGSLVLANVGDASTEALVKRGDLRAVTAVPELDQTTFFVILQR